jgi:sulfur carrier protein ThiS
MYWLKVGRSAFNLQIFLNMTATIRPYGMLKSYIDGEPEITVDSGRTIRQALQALGMPPEVVALVLVNDEQQPKDYVLQDGDQVKLMAVIGGGAS